MAEDLNCYFDGDGVAAAVADRLTDFAEDRIRKTGSCVVALSGGSTPNALFALLAGEERRQRLDWQHLYFLWVDERYLPSTDPENNFHKADKLLFSHVRTNRYPVPTGEDTVEDAARFYGEEVRLVLENCGKSGVDLALLGLGDDGHTASLFPGSVVLQERERWIAPVPDGKNWQRVTMTFPCLAEAGELWFTVVGRGKQAALEQVLRERREHEGESWEDRTGKLLPGATVTGRMVRWFVDRAALGRD